MLVELDNGVWVNYQDVVYMDYNKEAGLVFVHLRHEATTVRVKTKSIEEVAKIINNQFRLDLQVELMK